MVQHEPDPQDPGADTETFRAFVERTPDERGSDASGRSFRLWTLAGAALVLVVVVWLVLLR